MSRRRFVCAGFLLALPQAVAPLRAEPAMSRAQALQALLHAEPMRRLSGIERLAEVGTMADNDALAKRLRDEDETVRAAAAGAMWSVWSRSGDKAVDRQFQRGVELMNAAEWESALGVFDQIVHRKPDFAEGWNKRATVLYLMGREDASLKDCEEVLKRNRHHFGALSGMTQIYLRRGEVERALKTYERALEVNPNLDGGPQMLKLLEEAVRARSGRRTGLAPARDTA